MRVIGDTINDLHKRMAVLIHENEDLRQALKKGLDLVDEDNGLETLDGKVIEKVVPRTSIWKNMKDEKDIYHPVQIVTNNADDIVVGYSTREAATKGGE